MLSLRDYLLVKVTSLALLIMNYMVLIFFRHGIAGGIVLIRLDHIGDFIIWLDTAKVYRQLYPNQKITLVANSAWSKLAASLPYWDEVIELDTRLFSNDWCYRGKLLSKFRKIGYETAIQPTYSRNFLLGDSLIHVSGASNRIGSQGDCCNISTWVKRMTDLWYTRLIPASSKEMVEIERNAEFIQSLSARPHVLNLPIIPKLQVLPARLQIKGRYCVFFPGASWWGRQWPAKQFAKAAHTLLLNEHRYCVVICGGPNDLAICSEVTQLIGENAVNLCGQTSLPELIELIRESTFLISNETSAVHIAAAVGTPSVCILGGGHYGRFLPYPANLKNAPITVHHSMPCFGCLWQCNQAHTEGEAVPCIQNVSVDAVCAAVQRLGILTDF